MVAVEERLKQAAESAKTVGELLRALHYADWEKRVHDEASSFSELLELLWRECQDSNAAVFLYSEVRTAVLDALADLMTACAEKNWGKFRVVDIFRHNARFSCQLSQLKNTYINQLAEEYLAGLERELNGKTFDQEFWDDFAHEDSLEGKICQLKVLTLR